MTTASFAFPLRRPIAAALGFLSTAVHPAGGAARRRPHGVDELGGHMLNDIGVDWESVLSPKSCAGPMPQPGFSIM